LPRMFQCQTAALPRSTEVKRFIIQRVGQGIFRRGLPEYWNGRCAISGLAIPELLPASYIKPWIDCEKDAERLDVFNGFLLTAHFDAVFDAGFITVGNKEKSWSRGFSARKLAHCWGQTTARSSAESQMGTDNTSFGTAAGCSEGTARDRALDRPVNDRDQSNG
jgi:hypothetical protein